MKFCLRPRLLGTLLILFLVTLRLYLLYSPIGQSAFNTAQQATTKTESQQLFESMLTVAGFFEIRDNGHIILPARDSLLLRAVNGQAVPEQQTFLLQQLYYSAAGKAVQKQIKLWNHSRRFVAVRDNINQGGVLTSSWQGLNQWQEKLSGHKRVPLSYGFVNNGRLLSGFNDWLSIAGSGQNAVLLERKVALSKSKKILIQVIGKPDISHLPGKVHLTACFADSMKCTSKAIVSEEASVYVIALSLAAGKHVLRLPIKSVLNPINQVSGLSIYRHANGHFAWQPLKTYALHANDDVQEDFKFIVKSSDDVALINPTTRQPTAYSLRSGLITLLGYDAFDRYALSGLLARTDLAHDNTQINLTLNSKLQAIAQLHLNQEMKVLDQARKYTHVRRAAVVMLEPNSGAILAAANYPNPPVGVHHWDRLSFSRLYPSRDPFKVNAWQGLDNHNAPGSTFKPLTALAAMRAAEQGRGDLEKMLEGLKPSAFEKLTGLSRHSSSYQADLERTSKVSNSGNYPLAGMVAKGKKLRTTRGRGCPSRSPTSRTIGLREAVRDSVNTWFARLAVMMDESHLGSGGADSYLVKTADILGFGQVYSLSPESDLPLHRINAGAGRGDVLNAYTGSMTLKSEAAGTYANLSALQRLTQNSFGQGVAATPLQMARLAASIANGKIPQPYLISHWDGQALDQPDTVELEPDLIDYLRAGMKAVPETGTARRAFGKIYPNGRCRVFGKTGTAQVGKGKQRFKFNSAWFIGWREDQAQQAEISFACMVSHTYARGHRNGGDVCAPIIARILKDWPGG